MNKKKWRVFGDSKKRSSSLICEISKKRFLERLEKRRKMNASEEVELLQPPKVIDLTTDKPNPWLPPGFKPNRKFVFKNSQKKGGRDKIAAKLISFENRKKQIKLGFSQLSEIQQTLVRVPLFDSITLLRIETPVRGPKCSHLASFELKTFVS
ncbi:hypothetical protein MHBO_000090 [Bonamia ostreae]|uniref:SP-RING-type domain-containing protein n=1 Tax=Bonamia ostreae TaxID=126728 RepID=A0ABV2AFP2_9EUKA